MNSKKPVLLYVGQIHHAQRVLKDARPPFHWREHYGRCWMRLGLSRRLVRRCLDFAQLLRSGAKLERGSRQGVVITYGSKRLANACV
ncbi:hypothetical protein EDC61_11470 [Sulfuritortus calidifontis]|uniref:Uncharacterized protein n=1 Tax=Sulfuritortus calidifontis TaxID=1914471 RepID=A0A4R3JWM6_9PROT|nr:hypothetical protein EDC61_11470 [Sulfuritortus calidifontis]